MDGINVAENACTEKQGQVSEQLTMLSSEVKNLDSAVGKMCSRLRNVSTDGPPKPPDGDPKEVVALCDVASKISCGRSTIIRCVNKLNDLFDRLEN